MARGWSEHEWVEARERLQRRGLVNEDGTATEAGGDLRKEIERRTDELAVGPFQALGERRVDQLIHYLDGPARKISGADAIAYPNPMGLPPLEAEVADRDVDFPLVPAGDPGQAGGVLDDTSCYRAAQSQDARFDGWFFVGVTSTGIYCRPSCPARTPEAGECPVLPDGGRRPAGRVPGLQAVPARRHPRLPEWDLRADVVARAMRLIADGAVDRDGVPGLAARLGYSVRQLERLLRAEVGAGPLALARAQRAQTARLLIETTGLPLSEVAFAAGFASIRQFNDTVRAVFATTPTGLRAKAAGADRPDRRARPTTLSLRLPFRRPLCPDNLFGHLAATAVPGVEEVRRRRLPADPGPGPRAGGGGAGPHPRPHRVPAGPGRPPRPDGRHHPVPAPARPRRRPRGGRRPPRRRPGPPPAGGQGTGPAGAPHHRRRRAGRPRRPRPAGLHRRRPHPGRPAGDRRRTAGGRPGRRPHPPLPHPRGAGRPRRPAARRPAGDPPPAGGRPGRRDPRPGAGLRPGGRHRRPVGGARHRAVDRPGGGHAGARRPGRVPGHRPGGPRRRRGAGPPHRGDRPHRPRRGVATVAGLRRPVPVGGHRPSRQPLASRPGTAEPPGPGTAEPPAHRRAPRPGRRSPTPPTHRRPPVTGRPSTTRKGPP